jgi:hypothetical protein
MISRILSVLAGVIFLTVLLAASFRAPADCSLWITSAVGGGGVVTYRFSCSSDMDCPAGATCKMGGFAVPGGTEVYCSCDGADYPALLDCAAVGFVGAGGAGVTWDCNTVSCANPCVAIPAAAVPLTPAAAPVCDCP